ncbi:hypothetical protein F0L74_19910 [Chitinophaga agrisoli]|uniref:Uncharacterized protein n=1 Tax=Chitinophaga agrisoli TaxID=2607653 RepID=A0A5B2VH95_9BACT|nr:hypothetical protein [Chitinophaga agrisoli]KAA2238491.1 hypothetical protein F0L74_19910 [Chitinophaga agrisoli]
MSLKLSFPAGSFANTGDAFSFIYPFLHFDIRFINASPSRQGAQLFDKAQVVELTKDLAVNNDDYLALHDGAVMEDLGDDNINFVVYRRKPGYQLELFSINAASPGSIDITSLINAAGSRGFTMAIYTDHQKSRWQSELFVHHYEEAGRPHAHLRKIEHPLFTKHYGPVIDLSQNPGHEIQTYSMCLAAAPEMWFGPGSWLYFDQERVRSFTGALAITAPAPDIVYVHLFDRSIPDYETPEILALQQQFRQWVDMDAVEAGLHDKLGPHIVAGTPVIETITFTDIIEVDDPEFGEDDE